MREIKFRAWDEDEKCWRYFSVEELLSAIYFNDISALDVNHAYDDKNTLQNICQFTGLHDKNGKEIYEGDICRIDQTQDFEVVWKGIGFWFRRSDNELFSFIPQNAWIEIIGNIYENPELLEKGQVKA